MDYGHWQYLGEFDPSEWFGFIYRIIDTKTDREYIGKKQFHSRTTKPPLKGKLRKRKIVKESDWKSYNSSSTHVNTAITDRGKEDFLFLIESLHKTKASLHYAEVETQILEDVLRAKLPNGERKYYNAMIANIKFLPPVEVLEETRQKIRASLRLIWLNTDHHYFNQMTDAEKHEWNIKYRIGENNSIKHNVTETDFQEWLDLYRRGPANSMFGVTGEQNPNFGRIWSQEQRDALSSKMMGRFSGEANPRFGKSPFEYFSEERLASHKEQLSKAMSGENNPMYGKPCTYKMSEDRKEEWKKNISNGTRGLPKSEKTKQNMRKPKGPQEKITCPHCLATGGKSNMTRYHLDHCKLKKE